MIFSSGLSISMGWPIQAIFPSLLTMNAVGIPSWPDGGHPRFGHGSFVGLFFVGNRIDGHAVGHLVSHLVDEWFDLFLVLLPDADPDKGDLGIFLLKLGQMWDARFARPAPRRPEFHNVILAWLELADGLTLDERLDIQLGSRVADTQIVCPGWQSGGPQYECHEQAGSHVPGHRDCSLKARRDCVDLLLAGPARSGETRPMILSQAATGPQAGAGPIDRLRTGAKSVLKRRHKNLRSVIGRPGQENGLCGRGRIADAICSTADLSSCCERDEKA